MTPSALALASELPVIQKDERFNEFAYQSFLPRFDLFSASKTIVKAGKFPANHYAMIVSKDKLDDLGEKVLVYPLAFRYQAVDFSNYKATGKIVTSTDPDSEAFKAMQAKANDPNIPKGVMAPASYGIQFLLIVKDKGLATWFASSKSAKMIAASVHALIYNFAVFDSYFKTVGDLSWQAPSIQKSGATFDLPEISVLKKAISDFNGDKQTFEKEADAEDNVNATVTPPKEDGRPV